MCDVRSLAGPVLNVYALAGAALVREGQLSGTFFVIRAGRAELWHQDVRLEALGPGDCFGELDPTAREPQRYTVIAGASLLVLVFSAFGIGRLCTTIPGTRERILEALPRSGAHRAAAPLAERGLVEHGDQSVIGRDPAELAHQTQRTRNGLARRTRPLRELVLSQR